MSIVNGVFTTATDEPYLPGPRDTTIGYHPPARISQELSIGPNQRATFPFTLNKYRRRDWHLNVGRGSIIFNIQESVKVKGTHMSLGTSFQDQLNTMLNLQQMNFALATLSLRAQGFTVDDFFRKYNVVGIVANTDLGNRGRSAEPDVAVTVRGQATQVPNVWGPNVVPGMSLYLKVMRVPFNKTLMYRTSVSDEIQTFYKADTQRRSIVQAVPYAGWMQPDPDDLVYIGPQDEVFSDNVAGQGAPNISVGRCIKIGTCQRNFEPETTQFDGAGMAYADMAQWETLPLIDVFVDPVKMLI